MYPPFQNSAHDPEYGTAVMIKHAPNRFEMHYCRVKTIVIALGNIKLVWLNQNDRKKEEEIHIFS